MGRRTRKVPVGTRFGRLVITGAPILRPRSDGRNRAYWPVRCDCGNQRHVVLPSMESGTTTSCGCVHREVVSAANTVHGGRGTRLYTTWKTMRSRCYNPNATGYFWYGAKGVRMCSEWDDFAVFRDWALSHGYEDNLTIDRIDSSQNYTPDNCQWLTQSENSRRAQLGVRRMRKTNGQYA